MPLINEIFTYFAYLFESIVRALRLDPDVFAFVSEYPQSAWIVAGIMLLAGMSTLIGQSVVLFVNRVRRTRFFISLITSGMLFVVSYAVWGLIISLTGRFLFQEDPQLGVMIRLVGLSTAPLVFGFLILIPWMGPFIGKLLNIWSLLILINVVRFQFHSGFWGAVFCVVLGWLITLLLNNTIGKPLLKLRNRIFQTVAGSSLDATTQDILIDFTIADTGTSVMDGGKK